MNKKNYLDMRTQSNMDAKRLVATHGLKEWIHFFTSMSLKNNIAMVREHIDKVLRLQSCFCTLAMLQLLSMRSKVGSAE
jgi:hypothetical protein